MPIAMRTTAIGQEIMVFRKLQRIAAPAALLLAAGGMASCTAHHPGADISMPVGATSRDWPWFDRAVGPTQIYRNFDHGFHYATWTATKVLMRASHLPAATSAGGMLKL